MDKIFEEEVQKSQIGKYGTFVIALWSGHAMSQIPEYTSYPESKKNFPQLSYTKDISDFPPQSVVFVIPGKQVFENEYLTIDKNLTVPLLRWCRGLEVRRHTNLVYRTRDYYGYRHCTASDRFQVVFNFS